MLPSFLPQFKDLTLPPTLFRLTSPPMCPGYAVLRLNPNLPPLTHLMVTNQDLGLVWPECMNYLCINRTGSVTGRWCAICLWMFTSITEWLACSCQAVRPVSVMQPICFWPFTSDLPSSQVSLFLDFPLEPPSFWIHFFFLRVKHVCTLDLEHPNINEATLGAAVRSQRELGWCMECFTFHHYLILHPLNLAFHEPAKLILSALLPSWRTPESSKVTRVSVIASQTSLWTSQGVDDGCSLLIRHDVDVSLLWWVMRFWPGGLSWNLYLLPQ